MKNILDEQEEIIIKCSLEEMTKAFFKDYEIIWHDPNVNSEENQQYMAQLEKICKIKTFTEWRKAEDYIKAAKTVCHVITSGTNGELLVKVIFSSENVPKILTFCRNEGYHSSWVKNYEKVLCTETRIEDVISQIQNNLFEWHKQTSSFKLDLPAFAPIFDDWDKSQMNHLHLYLKVIPNFYDRTQAKTDFLSLSKEVYTHEENIVYFESSYDDYNKEAILKWYTRQSFVYKVINNCLRIATSDSIQYCRFLLKDIERAIKDQYQAKSKNFSGLLYRGAYLSAEEWSSLKANVNKEIEMHGFLSVTKDENIALNFVKGDPSKKMFITILVPKGPNEEEQGFAEVEEFSEFPIEKEVLFNVRSRFTVLATDEKQLQGLPLRHLVLFYGAQGLRRFVTEKKPVQHVSVEEFENLSCSRCQVPIPEMNEKMFFQSLLEIKGHVYCRNCLGDDAAGPFLCVPITEKVSKVELKGCLSMNSSQTRIPFYGYQCSKCGVKNRERYFVCTDCAERENRWCQDCFDKTLGCMEVGHAIILETSPFSFWCEKMSEKELRHLKFQNNLVTKSKHISQQQAEMYIETHEYEKALEYFHLFLRQNEIDSKDGTLITAENKKNQSQKIHPEIHSAVASTLGNIGVIYHEKGEYTKALEYQLKSLDAFRSIYEENHPDIATSYHRIGTISRDQGEYEKALEYLFKSLTILQTIYGENHPHVTLPYSEIGTVYQSQGKYNKALEYQFKSLNINKTVYEENHPVIGALFGNIALTYHYQGDENKALEYYSKSLDISKTIHGEIHPHVAVDYDNIGVTYESQGEYAKALEYHLKALEISKSVHGENHPDISSSLSNIGTIFSRQGEYNKALEYNFKSLGIRKIVHGEYHPGVAVSYCNIGSIYENLGEYAKALEYHLKALEISKSVHGENHPHVATAYNNIGTTYEIQGEYPKALENHSKSLRIKKIIYGENHPDVATVYNNIGALKYVYEENHPYIATSYNNLSSLYERQGEYTKAFEYHFKSLDIRKSVYGENHPHVATSYNNIGLMYAAQKEYDKALEYNFKSLSILKPVYGENHPNIASSYNSIGTIFCYQGEYSKALEYHLKALTIRKIVYRKNPPKVASSYISIGTIFCCQGEYNKALEHYFEALSIFKSIHEENHKSVVECYRNIAEAYRKQGKNEKALEYKCKAQGIDLLTLDQNQRLLLIESVKNHKMSQNDTQSLQ